jgi:hypothetical protein
MGEWLEFTRGDCLTAGEALLELSLELNGEVNSSSSSSNVDSLRWSKTLGYRASGSAEITCGSSPATATGNIDDGQFHFFPSVNVPNWGEVKAGADNGCVLSCSPVWW